MMDIGMKAGVPFEVACGGNAECATCHIYIPEEIIEAEDYEDALKYYNQASSLSPRSIRFAESAERMRIVLNKWQT